MKEALDDLLSKAEREFGTAYPQAKRLNWYFFDMSLFDQLTILVLVGQIYRSMLMKAQHKCLRYLMWIAKLELCKISTIIS